MKADIMTEKKLWRGAGSWSGEIPTDADADKDVTKWVSL